MGGLKARIAKLRRELLEPKSAGGSEGVGFDVKRTGDARVGLVGFPSVGKSTLLTRITGTASLAAAYEFTTLTTVPGTFFYKGAKVQLLDLPGIIEGAKDGKGRGRQVIGVARTCDLIIVALDAIKPLTHKRIIEKELEGFGIRLNKEKPNITFRKKERGGVFFSHTITPTHLDRDIAEAICKEYKYSNAEIVLHEDATADQLIDVIEGNRVYIPCLTLLNKVDAISMEELDILDKLPHSCLVSAYKGWNMEGLLEKMWEGLNLTRIYTKPRGMVPDYSAPVVLRGGHTSVADLCNRIHKDILKQMKHALVWGNSVKHQPQRVGKDHMLTDEDVVAIVKK